MNEHAWQIDAQESHLPDDPLLDCLVALTRIFERPQSAHSLSAGLPLVDSRLTPELFSRAAGRAGLSSRVQKRPLRRLPKSLLPAILLLRDRRACVLLNMDHSSGDARVLLPETGSGEEATTVNELSGQYTGYAILVRPEYRLDARAPEVFSSPTRHWFWGAITRQWRIYRDVLLASFLVNLFALAMPFFILNVYDRVVPNNAVETLWVLALGVAVIALFEFILGGLRAYFIDRAARQADVEISSFLFERVLGIKSSARPDSIGAFANNLQEFESIRDFITSATITTLIDLPFVFIFLAAIWWIGDAMVWIPVLAIPVILLYALFVQWPLRKAVENSFRASAQKNATLVESLVGTEAIKAFCAEGQIQRTWEQAVAHIARWRNRTRLLSTSTVNFASFARNVAVVGVVVMGVYQITGGSLTMGGLIACVILSRRAMSPMNRVVQIATRYFQARAALKTLNGIVDLPVERPYGKSYVQRGELNGGIEFDNVSFKYPGDDQQVLLNVSFSIKPGEHVAVVGRIGCGKTTLGKLLMGFYEPTSGAIYMDGTDVRQIDPIEIRRNIGYVSQDVILFYGSVRENMTLGAPHVDDEIIVRAADVAGVADFVDQSPKGFDMNVGERGTRLSGGQRQSLAIARALLLSPPMMLLDEPTSSMDNRTEQQLVSRLSKELTDKTVILITHRASLLEIVDRIIVMDNRTVVADGPKQEILEAIEQGKIRGAKGRG